MTVKIKHNKAHVLYKALGYDHCYKEKRATLKFLETNDVTSYCGICDVSSFVCGHKRHRLFFNPEDHLMISSFEKL